MDAIALEVCARVDSLFADPAERAEVGDQWKMALAEYKVVNGVEEFKLGSHVRFVTGNQMGQLNHGGTLLDVAVDEDAPGNAVITLKMYSKKKIHKLCRYKYSDGVFFMKISPELRGVMLYAMEDF